MKQTIAVKNEIQTNNFSDSLWDFMDPIKRERTIVSLFKNQVRFSKKQVPFYKKIYEKLKEESLNSLVDCATKIPIIRKSDIRNLPSPYDLIPSEIKNDISKLYLYRGTGGTTGIPTSIFFTKNDWIATVEGMVRGLEELKKMKKPIIAFNGYNQGHISGPIFDDTIRKIGGLSIARNFGSTDEQAVKQMAVHRCNLIIAPPVSTHKGGSIESLLETDVKLGLNYINGSNIDVIFCSSTELTSELYKELKNLGIKYIYNYYGSTEILPTAISCQNNPFEFHILFGHIALFVVGKNQQPVKNRERGVVLASRIGSYTDKLEIGENQGTQLLNYEVGDEVEFISDKCPCGRTTPRISGVKRIKETKDKIEGGCEYW